MKDDWLDAFAPEDLEDPELDALDASVARILAANPELGEAPSRPRWALAVVVALAAAALLWFRAPAPIEAPPAPPVESAPVVSIAPVAPENRLPEEAPEAVVQAEAPVEVTAPSPEPVPPSPRLLPGLEMDRATVQIEGSVAVLASGQLAYRHDALHDPGVGSVRLADLPLELRPVGTAFHVIARPQLAAMRVDQGAVELVHEEGVVVLRMAPQLEVVAIPDLEDELGVRLLFTGEHSLDQVVDAVPDDCLCRPEDVVAALTVLRLTPRIGTEP